MTRRRRRRRGVAAAAAARRADDSANLFGCRLLQSLSAPVRDRRVTMRSAMDVADDVHVECVIGGGGASNHRPGVTRDDLCTRCQRWRSWPDLGSMSTSDPPWSLLPVAGRAWRAVPWEINWPCRDGPRPRQLDQKMSDEQNERRRSGTLLGAAWQRSLTCGGGGVAAEVAAVGSVGRRVAGRVVGAAWRRQVVHHP